MPVWLVQLHAVWAYVLLIAVSFITEELAPLAGGFTAHEGHLSIAGVAWSCAIGTWAVDLGLYYLGRWRGAWARRRWPAIGRPFTRALMGVRRRPWRSSLSVRYAYGLRVALPLACGAAHVPLYEYLAGSAISAATWSSLFTVTGWVFGRTALLVYHHAGRYEDVILLAVMGLIGLLMLLYVRRTAAEESTHDVAARAFERELDILSGEYPPVSDQLPLRDELGDGDPLNTKKR